MIKRFILFWLFPFISMAQNTIGLPDITNFTKKEYTAGLQNWEIDQDKDGHIYVANNEGLLVFDGHAWTLYPLPNKTIVRAVHISRDQKIYVGGQDEMGYFSAQTNGELVFHSLRELIPKNDRNFGDVWDIVSVGNELFFRSSSKIFRYNLHSINAYPAFSEWSFLKEVNGKVYAHDYKLGLLFFQFNRWEEAASNSVQKLPSDDPVTGILPSGNGHILIATLKNGVFSYSSAGQITKLHSPILTDLQKHRIYSASVLSGNRFAFGTSSSGVYILDNNLQIVQRFSKTEGLLDNNVLNVFFDKEQNLWFGLNNGLSLVSYNSAIKLINPLSIGGSGYAAAIFQNKLFIGTSNGLYSSPLEASKKDLSFSIGQFSLVPKAEGQVWNLEVLHNRLFVGMHTGAYFLSGNSVWNFSKGRGFWNFQTIQTNEAFPSIVAGNYKGLSLFLGNKTNSFVEKSIGDFFESSRYVAIDELQQIWVSHPYHGVFKIYQSAKGDYIVKKYDTSAGLISPINNHLFKIRNKIVVAAEEGVYSYSSQLDKFVKDKDYQQLLGNQSLRYLKEDNEGNVWFVHDKSLGVIDFSEGAPKVIYIPELTNKLLSGFENVYPINAENIFISGESGMFHLNYTLYKQKKRILKTYISSVKISGGSSQILFGGHHSFNKQGIVLTENPNRQIENMGQTLRFAYSAHVYSDKDHVEYSVRLLGLDAKWSPWEKRSEKEYTNLNPREYTFEVKVRNNFGSESVPTQFSFRVLPPWYLNYYSLFAYFILLSFAFIKTVEWQKNKFKKQQKKFENERDQLLKIQELERIKSENEIVALQNEKLELEINHQNSAIAASAMHLVKKNELLAKIKNDLLNVAKNMQDPNLLKQLKKLINSVSNEDHMDKEWENFSIHFDKTHSDFLIHLKEKHPDISHNELKLSAYLRMNLTTKEIAQLSSISVRGVEISRYRLRKKLQLDSEVSLYDYLISI
jgi:ligand-binding sensor domain-containing protein/DNA-binding CsgD family transcriptional regulator